MPKSVQFPLSAEAFNEFYKAYFVKLCKYAYYLVNTASGAEELVQDFFTELWHKQHRLHLEGSLESYFFKSVKNAAFNQLKKQKHIQEHLTRVETPSDNYDTLNKDFFMQKLEESIQKLPEKTRVIYCLRYFEGLQYKEIADYLRISERTVDTHLYRGLKQLKKQLMPYKLAFYNTEVI